MRLRSPNLTYKESWKPIYFGWDGQRSMSWVRETLPAWVFALLWVLAFTSLSIYFAWWYIVIGTFFFDSVGGLWSVNIVVHNSVEDTKSVVDELSVYTTKSLCHGWRVVPRWSRGHTVIPQPRYWSITLNSGSSRHSGHTKA